MSGFLKAGLLQAEGLGGTLCPVHYYKPPEIFSPCDGPVKYAKIEIDSNPAGQC